MTTDNPLSSSSTVVDFDPFAGPVIDQAFASTPSQREIWSAVMLGDDASRSFNESVSLTLEGPLDVSRLQRAVSQLVARHQSLRATFSADGLTMVVAAPAEFETPAIGVADERELRRLQREEVEHVFPLEKGPLFRARIATLGPTSHVLVLTAHHIVFDGWSMGVCVKELGALYNGESLPPAPGFDAYARTEAQRPTTPEYRAALDYWQQRFTGSAPVLELPLDKPRPPARTFHSVREDYVLAPDLVAQLKKLGAKNGASFFNTVLAGFGALLHRLTGQDDLVIGIPAAGQNFTGVDGLVGHCVNTLPVRTFVEGSQPFAALLKSSRTAMLDAYEHQSVAFGALLERLRLPRDPSRLPLVSVLFNVDQSVAGSAMRFEGCTGRVATNPRAFENFEIFINASETPAGLVLETQYNADLYAADTMHRWLAAFEVMLRALIATPELPIARLPIIPDDERAKLVALNAATRRDFPRELTISQLIERQVDASPDAVAVIAGEQSLTYAQLDARANQLAHRLHALGVTKESLVGLYMDRSVDMVVALLGVLKAGGAYVPLDPAFPRDRLAFMVEDAALKVIVAPSALVGELPAHQATVVEVGATVDQPTTRVAQTAGPENVAYVIYTSGSTGKPKGVEVPHRAVVNFLTSMKHEPGLTAADTLVAVTTLSFDIAVLELQLPLTVGAKVVLATRENATDGAQLAALIDRHGATVMQATPSTWRLLIAAGWNGGPRFKALVGGEAVPRDLANELTRRTGSAWNMYGPTETTVWSTCWRFPTPVSRVQIGAPIANTQAWVLDAALNPLPVGVPGELHLGGDGVTRGYLHRPELTAERFIDDPFTPGAKLYKTGDVARVLPDGSLEYLRRNDNQVKVRGYRIELGEIEAALTRHPGVEQAAVLVREDRPGDVRLVAYLVGTSPGDAALRTHLKSTLPDYMVPQHFVVLPRFPLTPNNKVDRKALPPPQIDTSAEVYVAPRTDTEKAIEAIWKDVLGRERVSIHDDFFALGGHSLLAAQVMTRLNRELQQSLSMRKLFEAPTVAGLAALVGSGQQQAAPVTRIPHEERTHAPSSLMQQRMWFLEEIQGGTAVNNLPSAFRFKAKLDHAALVKSLNAIIARQPSMRTYFELVDGEPLQRVMPKLELELTPIDLSKLPVAQRDAELMTRLKAAANETISLTTFPLIRAQYFVLSPDESVLFYMPHHAIWDGWSFDIFLDELARHYEAFTTGKQPEVPTLPITYQDFAVWHREWLQGAELDRQSAYWKQQLADAPQDLEFPTDRPRGSTFSYRGATEPFNLSKEEIAALTTVGRASQATLYMVLLAAFKTALYRYTGHEDLLVGTPIRGRNQPELENLIGFFVNAIVLRTKPTAKKTFRDFLTEVRTTVLDAFSHQDMPFELLVRELNVRRDMSRTPLYQAFFTFQDVSNRGSSLGEVAYGQVNVHAAATQTDLSFWVKESGNGLVGGIDYAVDLFDRSTIVRFLDHLRVILRAVVADASQELARLPLLTPTEQETFARWNETKLDFPRDTGVHALIEQQVARTPDAVAVISGETKLTYAELDARANRLAAVLREEGLAPGQLAGLCLERDADLLVGLLAILKTGAAYVPLDPSFPRDRLAFMVEDARMPLVVTSSALAEELQLPAPRTLTLDTIEARLASASEQSVSVPLPAEAPCYVIYTSGSTGKPKGVQVPHRAVSNFLTSMQRSPGLSSSDVLLAVTTLSFDIAVLELHLPLSVGATIVLAPRDAVADGEALAGLISQHSVTTMQATPSTWRLLFDAGFNGRPGFRALVGGEAVPLELAQQLLQRAPGGVWNMYGPTETTVWSTTYAFPQDTSRVFIGKPIANTTVHVVDALGQQQPIGVPGELLIGGEGVTTGYLHRPELTAERFVTTPHGRLYRTGDVVRFRPDGNLEYQRRNDNQIKLRGYRIELGEIETALARLPGIKQAAVIVREDHPGDQRLVAYVVGAPESDAALRTGLKVTLPDYMVPQHFVTLPAFPLTPNGKLDRKALPAPAETRTTETFVAPRTPTEEAIVRIWAEVLKRTDISATDDFFAIGGHSMLATQVIARLSRELGVPISVRTLFEAPTVSGLAERVSKSSAGTVSRIPHREWPEEVPASAMQQRAWFLEQLFPGTLQHHLPLAADFSAPVNLAALQQSLDLLVARHESLRTTIHERDGKPVQRVAPRLSLPIASVPVTDEAALEAALRAETNRPFTADEPLVRVKFFQRSSGGGVFFFMPHHFIWDGASFSLFLDELATSYAAFSRGTTPSFEPLPVTYRDFSEWHRGWLNGPELASQSSYWLEKLRAPTTLELPTDKPRPPNFDYLGASVPFTLGAEALEAITTLGRRVGATPYMVMLAAFKTLLHRYTGQDDLLVGTPVRGRSHVEVERVLGFFVNTVVVRSAPAAQKTFLDFLTEVRGSVVDALAHQDMPFDVLLRELGVARDTSRAPLYQSFFTYLDVSARQSPSDWKLRDLAAPTTHADLAFWVQHNGTTLEGALDFATSLFERATVERMVGHFHELLRSIIADPTQPLGRLSLLPADEVALFARWNETKLDFPRDTGVHALIEQQVARTPDAVAVISGETKLTYAQLDARANRLAAVLREEGLAPGQLAGLCLERDADLLVGLLAILKTGAAYVPLDPSFPRDRLAFMVEDARMPLVVTSSALAEELQLPAPRTLTLDTIEARLASASEQSVSVPLPAEAPCYVIYTSGSTGKPKGVQVPHRAVSNFLTSMQRSPGLSSSDVLLAVTTLSFDIAVLELHLPLSVGATIVLAPRDAVADGEALSSLISQHSVTTMQATPSTWRLLFDAGFNGRPGFRALVGGEAVPLELAQQLLQRAPGGVWNMYGPTETTVWSTTYAFPPDTSRVFIGKPIANTTVHVVDALGQQQPIGVPGELLIGGEGVTTGYLHRPELTAERFVTTPHGRLYRTGDVVRFRPDGNLEYQRRNDNQIKLRGYRIELGEIETALADHRTVAQAVVMVREDRPGDQRLVAYLMNAAGEESSESELRKHLRTRLPDYMIPQHFVTVERYPLTPNGKIDRKALPAPHAAARDADDYVAPRTANEKLVAEVWAAALQLERVGLHDSFFNLGGHSLLSLTVISQLQARTGHRLSPRLLLLNTLEQVAAALPASTTAPPAKAPPTPAAAPKDRGLVSNLVGGVLSRLKKGLEK